MSLVGGWGVAVQIEDDHKQLVSEVKALINQALNYNHTSYTILEVRQQVVAGMNWQFKLQTENNKIVVVKVFEPLPHTHQPAQVTLAQYQN